jgi:multisubunit Na+/H+ antiporter MnhB subunit
LSAILAAMTKTPLMVTSTLLAKPRFPWLAFGLCQLLYVLLVAINVNDIEEDTFIYFRFAKNIAEGYGYVFNIGGEHIESCSGLLWLGLLIALYHLPLHWILSTKLLCLFFASASIGLLFQLSQRFVKHRLLSLFPPFLVVVSIPFYIWSPRGLETAFYWFTVLWLLTCVTSPVWRHYWAIPALAVLNARPEGFLMVAAVLPYLVVCVRHESYFWRNAVVVFVCTLAVTAWRFWYFHDLLPHPFYFKVNDDHTHHFKNLLIYGWHSGWLLLAAVALPGVFSRWHRQDLALLGLLVMAVLWNVYVPEDKAFNRHMGILVPFVSITALMLLARWLPVRFWARNGAVVVMTGLCVFTLLFSRYVHFNDSHPAPFIANFSRAVLQAGSYWPEVGKLIRDPDHFDDNPQRLGIFSIRYNLISSVGDFVRSNYADDVTVVYDQVGQAPWYAGSKTIFIDNLGLCYRDIGLLRFRPFAEASVLYSLYDTFLQGLLNIFWPDEQRYFSEEQVMQRILEKQPEVLIIRKPYLRNAPDSLFGKFLRLPAVAEGYQARYLLNGREIVFERVQNTQKFSRYTGQPVVPPGATVERITQFGWCENGEACWSVGEPIH